MLKHTFTENKTFSKKFETSRYSSCTVIYVCLPRKKKSKSVTDIHLIDKYFQCLENVQGKGWGGSREGRTWVLFVLLGRLSKDVESRRGLPNE